MKNTILALAIASLSIVSACNSNSRSRTANANAAKPATAAVSPTPAPTAFVPKNGDYDGKGVVTKINTELGSVEMDHENIPDVMPAMRMEFYVTDKRMLDGLKVGDPVDFVLRYKDRTETIVKISKSK